MLLYFIINLQQLGMISAHLDVVFLPLCFRLVGVAVHTDLMH